MKSKETLNVFEKFGEPRDLDELGKFVIDVVNSQIDSRNEVAGLCFIVDYSTIYDTVYNRFNEIKKIARKGFKGRIWISFKEKPNFITLSTYIKKSNTYTGSGGGGDYGCLYLKYTPGLMFSWDYRFYLDEFPAIEMAIQEEELICALMNKEYKNHHKFVWEML